MERYYRPETERLSFWYTMKHLSTSATPHGAKSTSKVHGESGLSNRACRTISRGEGQQNQYNFDDTCPMRGAVPQRISQGAETSTSKPVALVNACALSRGKGNRNSAKFGGDSNGTRWRSKELTHLCSFKWDLSLETIFLFQVGV